MVTNTFLENRFSSQLKKKESTATWTFNYRVVMFEVDSIQNQETRVGNGREIPASDHKSPVRKGVPYHLLLPSYSV